MHEVNEPTNNPNPNPTPKARDLWPSYDSFGNWVSRNCITCRWRYKPFPNTEPPETCNVPTQAFSDLVKDVSVSLDMAKIIYGPRLMATVPLPTPAPYACQSRKDKRGRPESKR